MQLPYKNKLYEQIYVPAMGGKTKVYFDLILGL
jgi:hypothetical protein